MDCVREGVVSTVLHVVVQVMDVHVAVAEALAWCKVEVTDYLVHLDETLDAAAFAPLRVQVFSVVLALALLYAFTAAE